MPTFRLGRELPDGFPRRTVNCMQMDVTEVRDFHSNRSIRQRAPLGLSKNYSNFRFGASRVKPRGFNGVQLWRPNWLGGLVVFPSEVVLLQLMGRKDREEPIENKKYNNLLFFEKTRFLLRIFRTSTISFDL
jgi:hypothetical protein